MTSRSLGLAISTALLGVVLVQAGPLVVDTAVYPANGHTYYLLSPTNWTASEAAAVALGGHLATINDAAENQWIFNRWGLDIPLWIGLNDAALEGTFVWTSGEPLTYTNWKAGEPNGAGGDGSDYVHIHPTNTHPVILGAPWNDISDVVFSAGFVGPFQGVVEIAPTNAITAATRYVSPTGEHVSPFTNWITAATTIADAVSVAMPGDEVIVGDGVYSISNQLAVTSTITIRSLNGPRVTIVDAGYSDRCLYLSNSEAVVVGLTFRNGTASVGGGVYMLAGVLRDCVVQSCNAEDGGGVYMNSGGLVDRCTIVSNTVYVNGGGLYLLNNPSTVRNSLIVYNVATNGGGGVRCFGGGVVENCTIAENTALGVGGGGIRRSSGSSVSNSIIYLNHAASSSNWLNDGAASYEFCCLTPAPTGTGNITADPRFYGNGDFHLASLSPCIDRGTNAVWMATANDLDGVPRILNGRVDMGAYEMGSIAVDILRAVEIKWNSVSGHLYQVLSCPLLVSNTWTAVGDPIPGTGGTNYLLQTTRDQPGEVFYRVIELR